MKLAIIAFTRAGCTFAKRIRDAYEQKGNTCVCHCKGRDAAEWGIPVLEGSLKEWTGNMFRECDSLLFIGAAGIAVRAIAPFVASKTSDPAVLVRDEQGHFVISLLVRHLGGASPDQGDSGPGGAVPVITTATDAGGRFSVDDFARPGNICIWTACPWRKRWRRIFWSSGPSVSTAILKWLGRFRRSCPFRKRTGLASASLWTKPTIPFPEPCTWCRASRYWASAARRGLLWSASKRWWSRCLCRISFQSTSSPG